MLAILSLAPAGLLRATSPCPSPLQPACGCPHCGDEAPASPALDAVSCGCCDRAPAPEPAQPSSPSFDLLAAPVVAEFDAPRPARPRLVFDLRGPVHEYAPPARLLFCVHLI